MQINQTNLNALYKGYKTLFLAAYTGADADKLLYQKLCMRVPSMSASEVYSWLGAFPGMRELLGEAIIKNLSACTYSIPNRQWEDTVSVKETDLEYDREGIYNPLFTALGDVARAHPEDLLAEALANGFTTLCYTGKNFFDIDHEPKKGGTKFTNKGTKKISQANFRAARAALKSIRNSEGRPMKNGKDLVLVVSPTYEATAREILTAELVQGNNAAVSNVDRDSASLEVMPELLQYNEHAWFILEQGRAVKPFIHQVVKEAQLLRADNPEDSKVILTHTFVYQGYGIYNVGYGFPELAWGSTGADAA